jgi:hypothetical protein
MPVIFPSGAPRPAQPEEPPPQAPEPVEPPPAAAADRRFMRSMKLAIPAVLVAALSAIAFAMAEPSGSGSPEAAPGILRPAQSGSAAASSTTAVSVTVRTPAHKRHWVVKIHKSTGGTGSKARRHAARAGASSIRAPVRRRAQAPRRRTTRRTTRRQTTTTVTAPSYTVTAPAPTATSPSRGRHIGAGSAPGKGAPTTSTGTTTTTTTTTTPTTGPGASGGHPAGG